MALDKLDRTDIKLIKLLQDNARYSLKYLAEQVCLSTPAVSSRIDKLEKNGYIHRDPAKPRAIEIVDDNFNMTRREVVNVPIIGTVAAGQPLLAVENIEN